MQTLESPLISRTAQDGPGVGDQPNQFGQRPHALSASVGALSSNRTFVSAAAQFVRHYVEMVLAMMVGMMFPGGAVRALLVSAGYSAQLASGSYLSFLIMAGGMSASMAAWMRYRGHNWRQVAEMAAAMLVPSTLLVALDRSLFGPSHLVMLLSMLALMLYRRQEYVHVPVHASGGVNHESAS